MGTETMKLDLIRIWSLGIFLCSALTFTAGCGGSNPKVQNEPTNSSVSKPDLSRCTPASQASFLAVGDIMLSRGVQRAIDRAGTSLLPFSELTELFGSTDFNFGNFESPISGNDQHLGHDLIFNTRRKDVEGLNKYNFKIVQLANNHAMDQGENGMRFTREYLTSRGILHVGTGDTKDQAWQPQIITANGIRIAFLAASYASVNDGGVTTKPFVARIEDLDYMRRAISQLKSESDIIVVAMHAGIEYTRQPHRPQVDFAHAAIDAGADMVIGAHPHWIQTIETYKERYIFYSLGNFIFDQRKPDTIQGLTLRIKIGRDTCPGPDQARIYVDQVELLPVVLERLGIPRRATQAESTAILKKIGVDTPILRSKI